MNSYCRICGAECSGRLKEEARRNTYYDVCTCCFERVKNKPMKEVRKLLKK